MFNNYLKTHIVNYMAAATASIAQEFDKVRKEWARVHPLKSWRIAIWVTEFQDIDMVDKFIETERMPVGMFDDIFFRFDTEYTGHNESFEQALWQEYASWFTSAPTEKQDMLLALQNDGLLQEAFTPNIQLSTGFTGLMQELLRFKSAIKGLEKDHFCLYFPPVRPEVNQLKNWFTHLYSNKQEIPKGIRLVTIDYATDRKIKITQPTITPYIVEITPKLNMQDAIINEMAKGGDNSDTVGIDERFRKQIQVVMASTAIKEGAGTPKAVRTLVSLSTQINTPSALIAAQLIGAQAHYSIKQYSEAMLHCDKAIQLSQTAMEQNDDAGYPSWKTATMLKGALLAGKNKFIEAIAAYERLALMATEKKDAFYIMEGYRLAGHFYYQEGNSNTAFEKLLLAMVGGSYLEQNVIRQSTFLLAASLAMHIAKQSKPYEQQEILKEKLQQWVGKDWQELIEAGEMNTGFEKQGKAMVNS
jgi:tetratricopeptide (TPR) repeat protein